MEFVQPCSAKDSDEGVIDCRHAHGLRRSKGRIGFESRRATGTKDACSG